jgi:hypothetical protein
MLDDDQNKVADHNAGITKLIIMLVEELDAQGSMDKTLLVRRLFDAAAELESGTEGQLGFRDRAIIDQFRAVARPLDTK